MALEATGARVVFFGSHKQPSYVVETCAVPKKDQLKEGEILVKILLSTICSKDLENISGQREVKPPCVLGHEGIGEVIFCNRNDLETKSPVCLVGDRIVFTLAESCGSCQMCKFDHAECCSSSIKYGCSNLKDGTGLNGCYATHMVIKSGTHIVKVPENVSNAIASPANCALATMVHAISYVTSDFKKEKNSAIIQGANLMGLYGCALLHEAGFKKVYCHDISCEKLRLVHKFGGIPVLVNNQYDLDNDNEDAVNGIADVVIDVCGEWDVVPYALQALCHRGIYLVVGTAHKERDSTVCVNTILKKCITIRGIQGYKSPHLSKAIEFLSKTESKYPYEALVSSPFPLQDFHSAVAYAKSKKYYRTTVKPPQFSVSDKE